MLNTTNNVPEYLNGIWNDPPLYELRKNVPSQNYINTIGKKLVTQITPGKLH